MRSTAGRKARSARHAARWRSRRSQGCARPGSPGPARRCRDTPCRSAKSASAHLRSAAPLVVQVAGRPFAAQRAERAKGSTFAATRSGSASHGAPSGLPRAARCRAGLAAAARTRTAERRSRRRGRRCGARLRRARRRLRGPRLDRPRLRTARSCGGRTVVRATDATAGRCRRRSSKYSMAARPMASVPAISDGRLDGPAERRHARRRAVRATLRNRRTPPPTTAASSFTRSVPTAAGRRRRRSAAASSPG